MGGGRDVSFDPVLVVNGLQPRELQVSSQIQPGVTNDDILKRSTTFWINEFHAPSTGHGAVG
jgi:hypothetical protein